MAEPAQIRLYLNLLSLNLNPEEISARLGVSFDSCHRIGEPRGRMPQKFWETNWWTLKDVSDSTYGSAYEDLPFALHRLIARVDPAADAFAELARDGSADLSIVIESNGYPGMNLPAALLAKIARLGISLDFDLYCERECERPHADAE